MHVSTQKLILWLSVAVSIETAIGAGTVSLTNAIPSAWIPTVVAWCGIGAFIGSTIVAALAGNAVYGTKVTPPVSGPAAKVALFLAIGIGLLLFGGSPSWAATAATAATRTDPLATLMAQLSAVKADTVSAVVADITAADADASAIDPVTKQVKDPISHACYPALIQFLQSLPTSTPPTGKLVLVQLFQKKRDFVAQIQAGLPTYLKLGCAPLLGDEVQIFISTMAMVGVKIAAPALTAMFPPLAPVTLPALTLVP